ncbi:MAG: ABC transporter substrate-binding protein [Deinococcota bacterium]
MNRWTRLSVLVGLLGVLTLASAQDYQQAPSIAADLPPVAERLPVEPLVLEPVETIGSYGGTWRKVDYDDSLGWTRQTVMVEPFVKFNRDLNGIRPNLVTSWEWNDDATEITLNFREGVKWSDGAPLTVDDYLFWWNDMALNEDVPVNAPTYTRPAGEPMQVEKLDDYSIRLSFAEPNPLFLEFTSRGHYHSAQHVVPAHYLRQFHPDYSDATDTDDLMARYNTSTRFQHTDMPTFNAWQAVTFNSGQNAVFERNPYYWKVDSAGNQLPYIDRIEVQIAEGNPSELVALKAIAGELDMQIRDVSLQDVPLVLENAEVGDYRVIMWSRGDFGWPWLMLMYDYPDEGIVDLMYTQDFRRALSLGMNRQRINDIVALGLATPRQAALSPEGAEFQSDEGQAVYEAWAGLDINFNSDEAASLLDGIGVVDADGDGFRDRPDGSMLELIVDVSATDLKSIDTVDLIKQDWEAIGLRTTINTADPNVIDDRANAGEVMIRAWGSAAAWGLISAPTVWAPVEGFLWSIGGVRMGQHYQTGGNQGVAPRPGSALEQLQAAYSEVITLADPEARNARLLEAYQIHIDEGPLTIGTIGEHVSPVVVKNNFRNVQDTGLVASWDLGFPGTADPEQFFFDE